MQECAKSIYSKLGTVNKPRGQPYGGGGSLKDHVLPHDGGRGWSKDYVTHQY